MSEPKKVMCKKLGMLAPALANAPYPGPIGERILSEISQPAWDAWMLEQTKWINELRLDATDATSIKILEEKMMNFLFSEKPIDAD